MLSTPKRSFKRTRAETTTRIPVAYRITLLAVLFATLLSMVKAWSPNATPFRRNHRIAPHNQQQHETTQQKPNQQQSLTSQHMLKHTGSSGGRVSNTPQPRTQVKLSHSVLASCDTLPSFPTAHGLLSPETVMQLEGDTNPSVARFLRMYHTHGPLSCVPMLGDPAILPHLTHAMRKIAV